MEFKSTRGDTSKKNQFYQNTTSSLTMEEQQNVGTRR